MVKYASLWARWRESHDLEARSELIETYLWLVRYVAGRLVVGLPAYFDQSDIEGNAVFGLIDAVDRYDPDRGIRFETFAIPWVRGAALQGIRALQWAPALRKRVRQMEKAQTELERLLGREPTHQELAQRLNLTPDQLDSRIAEAGCLSVLSLEETFADEEGEGSNLANRLADPNAPDPAESSYASERRDLVARAIDALPEQERIVVSLFYFEGLLAREISDLLGLSPARISQIHSQAIFRLRGKLARMRALLVS